MSKPLLHSMFRLYSVLSPHYSLLTTVLCQFLWCIAPATQHIGFDKAGVLFLQFHIDADTVLRPLPQEVAVVQVGKRAVTKLGVGFMVAAAAADPTNPAGLTHRFVLHVGAVEELVEALVLEPFLDVAVLMLLGTGEAMAKVDITIAVHVKQTKSSPTREKLVRAGMDIG